MSKTYAGGCACGAIRYEAKDDPIAQVHCQCRACQRRSGTGHSSYLVFPQRSEVSVSGEAREWRVAGDSGNQKAHAFCPNCGTPTHVTFLAKPDVIAIHATSLDDPSRFEPQVLTCAASGLEWDTIDPAMPRFERTPPN